MKIIDPKVHGNFKRYILQCLAVTIIMYIVILFINATLNTTLVASLAATTFIIFAMPHKNVSNPRIIIGGYTVSSIVGVLAWLTSINFHFISIPFLAALTIGLCIFGMTTTNTEHPPATAFAFGLLLDGFTYKILAVIYIVILFLSLIKHYTKKWLIDLM